MSTAAAVPNRLVLADLVPGALARDITLVLGGAGLTGLAAQVAIHTPLQPNLNLSERYGANIFLKREDLQTVRSYKIRGAYNKMAQLSPDEKAKGVVCASAGNHAQGVAYACRLMGVKGTIFMPMILLTWISNWAKWWRK